jgi:DNA helicase-2/ATP-dependent DNA helicase PcrA
MTGYPIKPDMTDKDIAWIANTVGLDALDGVKLAILARKWRHPTSGICVLSHTNVAREEIQSRLGRTPVGQHLLHYPHFIDTIHTFPIVF